jgi:hypothetical protein
MMVCKNGDAYSISRYRLTELLNRLSQHVKLALTSPKRGNHITEVTRHSIRLCTGYYTDRPVNNTLLTSQDKSGANKYKWIKVLKMH